ncbi:hypothetical protein AMECASPLE_033745 [Ameca splendens]|uniref:Uncharacterized protein n=1 Tax=Ameca splendens TaxID=208324 RepID=A0ABV0Z4U5_9TELE
MMVSQKSQCQEIPLTCSQLFPELFCSSERTQFYLTETYKPVVSNMVEGQVVVRARSFRSMKKHEEPHRLQISLGVEKAELLLIPVVVQLEKDFATM